MDKEANHGGDILTLVAWADAHRKQLIWGAVAVAVVGLSVGLYFMYKNGREDSANAALFALQLPIPGRPITATEAGPFAQVAEQYPDTSAGARAMLLAAGIYFEANQLEQSTAMFQRLLATHTDYPLANLAAIGIAVNLEVQGKLPEAASRYEVIASHTPPDQTWWQAHSALARIYTEQNHPERAFEAYRQMLEARNNDSWTMEAQTQVRELLDKYPALRQQLAAQEAAAQAPAPARTPPANTSTSAAPAPAPVAPGPTLNLGIPPVASPKQ